MIKALARSVFIGAIALLAGGLVAGTAAAADSMHNAAASLCDAPIRCVHLAGPYGGDNIGAKECQQDREYYEGRGYNATCIKNGSGSWELMQRLPPAGSAAQPAARRQAASPRTAQPASEGSGSRAYDNRTASRSGSLNCGSAKTVKIVSDAAGYVVHGWQTPLGRDTRVAMNGFPFGITWSETNQHSTQWTVSASPGPHGWPSGIQRAYAVCDPV